MFEDVDVGGVADGGDEGHFDGEARGVAAGVEDAGAAVGGFAGLGEFAVFPVERDAEADEVPDAIWAFGAEDFYGFGAAEAGAGAEGVFDVLFDAVVGVHDGGDAALGVAGVGFGESGFCNQGDLVGFREFERGDESGDA